jgi:hypothetical protein
MTATLQTARPSYAYRRTRPFSNAEYKFKVSLAEYASEALLRKLRSRTSRAADANQYTGISVRVADDVVYLEAILTNATEWGGFGFDFARLIPVKGGLYNLSLRRGEDWIRAEQSTVAAASNYFINTAISPRAVDWIQITRGKTFQQCIDSLTRNLDFEQR